MASITLLASTGELRGQVRQSSEEGEAEGGRVRVRGRRRGGATLEVPRGGGFCRGKQERESGDRERRTCGIERQTYIQTEREREGKSEPHYRKYSRKIRRGDTHKSRVTPLLIVSVFLWLHF